MAEIEPSVEAARNAQASAVTRWNATVPVGAPVRYWTGWKEGDGKTGRTRTAAQLLGGHTGVVWVEGEASCIALGHVVVQEVPVHG